MAAANKKRRGGKVQHLRRVQQWKKGSKKGAAICWAVVSKPRKRARRNRAGVSCDRALELAREVGVHRFE